MMMNETSKGLDSSRLAPEMSVEFATRRAKPKPEHMALGESYEVGIVLFPNSSNLHQLMGSFSPQLWYLLNKRIVGFCAFLISSLYVRLMVAEKSCFRVILCGSVGREVPNT
jgi:hypothetical protein